jgi:uncharacterized protein YndB with AHSA1/START domain
MEAAAAERELKTIRRIPASRARVWAAMTDARALNAWWGPAGFTNTTASCDLRAGGDWVMTMHAPNGASYPNRYRFVELRAQELWVIDHVTAPLFRLTMALSGHGEETVVDWCQAFVSAEDCAKLRAICVPANEQNLDRLTAAVAAAKS